MQSNEQDPRNSLSSIDLMGQTINDVVLERRISISEHNQIYRGTQRVIERPVLFKLWPPMRSLSDLQDHRGIHEARALSSLRHPNVVTLYDSGLYRDTFPYLVTEYLNGGSLREMLQRHGPLPLTRALGILQQLASALEEIHHHDMLHRNLSTSCIFFENLVGSGQELVKLSGMEMCKIGKGDDPNDSALPETSQYNPQYMAPEQILGGGITTAIDMYACGVLLFEMLAGRLPYAHSRPPELWDDIVNNDLPTIGDVVPKLRELDDLQNLLDLLLNRRAEGRLDNARHLRLFTTELLDELLGDDREPWTQEVEAFPAIATSLHAKPTLPPSRPNSAKPPEPRTQVGRPATRVAGRRQGADGTGRPKQPQPPPSPQTRPRPDRPSARPRPDIQHRRGNAPARRPPTPNQPPPVGGNTMRRRRQASLLIGPDAHKKVPRTRPGGLNHIFWIGPVPQRLEAAKDDPYLIIAAESKTREPIQANSRLSGGQPILLHAKLSRSFMLLAITVPTHKGDWLGRMGDHAFQNNLTVGVILDRRFPGSENPPSERLSRTIINAAMRGKAGWLMASRNTVESLSMDAFFGDLDSESQGRYSSLMLYQGPPPS
ncbi:MAG: serine/threonine-protein kinase [Myxococcota bacterium]